MCGLASFALQIRRDVDGKGGCALIFTIAQAKTDGAELISRE